MVWGVVYLAEAAARVVIVETTSTGTALAVSKVMPYAVAGVLVAWMVLVGRRARREGERRAAEAAQPEPQRPEPQRPEPAISASRRPAAA